MGRVTTRSHQTCPLLEDFHIRNILGSRERRQVIFGSTEYCLTAGGGGTSGYSDFTFDHLTGGLVTEVDHSLIFAQKWASAPINRTRISFKTSTGFRLVGDLSAGYDIIIVATLPTSPRATPKWAKDYCPGCKDMDFWGIVGSIYKDVGLVTSRVKLGAGGTLAFTFKDHTAYWEPDGSETDLYLQGAKGSEKSPAVQRMVDSTFQAVLFPSDTPFTVAPWTGTFATDGTGFTIIGDANEYLNVLCLGQIAN